MKISNGYKDEFIDSFSFTVGGSLFYWFVYMSKFIGYFGILTTAWYLRDDIYNLVLFRRNYKYPDIEVKINEEYSKIIQLNSLSKMGIKELFNKIGKIENYLLNDEFNIDLFSNDIKTVCDKVKNNFNMNII